MNYYKNKMFFVRRWWLFLENENRKNENYYDFCSIYESFLFLILISFNEKVKFDDCQS